MSKPITIGQSHNLVSILINNTDWNVLDGDVVQGIINNPLESGKQFTAFLKNGGKVFVGEPKTIPIDRTQPFDPAKFIGEGWTIEEQDERALKLGQLDLSKVQLEHMIRKGESSIKGEEKLGRLKKAGYVRLDAKIFQTLWESKELISESWKQKTNNNTTYIFFDGTVLRGPSGNRFVFSLYWDAGQWDWLYYWLEDGWDVDDPSAVLASQELSS